MTEEPLPTSSKIILTGEKKAIVQKQPLPSTPEASFSCILTQASYMCYLNPDLPPPGCKPSEKNKKDE